MNNATFRQAKDEFAKESPSRQKGNVVKPVNPEDGIKPTQLQATELVTGREKPAEDRTMLLALMQFIFPSFLPLAIRKYCTVWVQIMLGSLIFIALLVLFIGLFIYYGECKIEVEETSQIRSDADCRAHLLTQITQLGLDTHNKWSSEQDYDVVTGGPWQIDFRAYEANQSVFDQNINDLQNSVQDLMDGFENQTFFDNLVTAFFYESVVNGTVGSAVLTSDIDINTVFQNYVPRGLQVENFKEDLMNSMGEQGAPRLPKEQMDFSWSSTCLKENGAAFPYWNCTHFNDNEEYKKDGVEMSITNGIQYINSPSSTIKTSLPKYQIAQYRYYTNMSIQQYEDDIQLDLDNIFEFEWSFTEAMVFSFCNSQGKDHCQELLDYSSQNFTEDEFTLLPGFWSSLTSRRPIPSENFNKQLVLRAAYISDLESFGFIIGSATFNRMSISWPYSDEIDLVAVPEVMTLPKLNERNFEFNEPSAQGKQYHICQSCQQYEEFLVLAPLEADRYNSFYDCQAVVGVFLHLYGFDKFASKNTATIDFDYVSTIVYYFDQQFVQQGRKSAYITQNFFLYNTRFSQVFNLHCNADEWNFKKNENETWKTPFVLNSGIHTCQYQVCRSVLERLANSQANTELAFLVTVLIIIAVFVCVVLPGIRSKIKDEREKKIEMIQQALADAQEEL